MRIIVLKIAVVALSLLMQLTFAQSAGQIKILFDCTKAETSGNADWTIDADVDNLNWNPYASTGGTHSNPQQYPTPTQTAVTTSTAETYWTGSLSNWAVDCVNQGYWVETLGAYSLLTYNYGSNAQDLSKYQVFIVDEPNIMFTANQKTAIMNFVLNGGSLFMISDHDQSDRNGDGYDSPTIWNDFITNNGVLNDSIGFTFDLQNFSMTSYNCANSPSDSLLHGAMGNVTQVKWTNGTSMTLNPSKNPSVKGIFYKTGSSNTGTTGVMCAYARVGCGKVVGVGDSSIPDDGTGNPNATLYNGYTQDAAGNHRRLLMNAVIWLAQNDCVTGINNAQHETNAHVYPNPANDNVFIDVPGSDLNRGSIEVYNTYGQLQQGLVITNRVNGYALDVSALPAGVYNLCLKLNNQSVNRKLIVTR